jgi:folate-binding protein YgfZ
MEAPARTIDREAYDVIRSGGGGFYETPRGLIAIWGKEAVPFLDGMMTNDVKTLADGAEMLAAFPNAQARLLAIVRLRRQGDRYLLETEEATREKLYQNLFRFTFAGDFFVEDLSDKYSYFQMFGAVKGSPPYEGGVDAIRGRGGSLSFDHGRFVPVAEIDAVRSDLIDLGTFPISDDLYETLRIENGIPKYGIDMDETTIVPELGIDDLISYNKGCYVGQEIIARIHFRGHVAKRLTGLVLSETLGTQPVELQSIDGKNAGRITSVTYSPKLDKTIALAFVRYDFLDAGTKLLAGDIRATVTNLPFID